MVARAATTVSAVTLCVVAGYKRREICSALRFAFSKYVNGTKNDPAIAHEKVLREFRETAIDLPGGKSTNPHKRSAAIRTAAVSCIRAFNLKLGTLESSISMSRRDLCAGIAGTRSYYWTKDLDKTPVSNDSGARSFVDVDYHVDDIEHTLAGSANHALIFTIMPHTAARSAETSHTFTTNGEIDVIMAGGGRYRHQLWDWNSDIITCSKRFLGIPLVSTVYKVEKKDIDGFKALVVLAPLGTWTGFGAIALQLLQGGGLRRFNPVTNGFAHITCAGSEGICHSIAKCGDYTSAEFSDMEFSNMGLSAEMGKQEPTVSAMATWSSQRREDAIKAAAYLRAVHDRKTAFTTSVADAVESVSANVTKHGDSEERVSVQAFMQPIVAGNCHAHTDHPDNAEWAVQSRVTKFANAKAAPLNPFVLQCVGEFVSMAFPSRLGKADLQTVYEKQTRPVQRHIIAEAVDMGPSEKTSLKAFLKKEAYAGAKDPRIITTYRPGTKIGYSVYMYALTLQMKEHAWYGFKSPEEVAARVAEICSGSEYAVEGDFSRMDGRIGKSVRETFEKAILNRCFPDDEEVHRLHKLQYGQTVGLATGSYDQGYARGSGSPETSVFNTALTAFVMYLGERMSGKTPEDAFANIGIVAGDDSLQGGHANVLPEIYGRFIERSARQMGQLLTSDIKLIGEPVQFLSRYFGGAWHGDMNSMSCPLRLLSKIHAAVNLPETVLPEDKCYTKGMALLAPDANTPIIGAVAKKMMSVGQELSTVQKNQITSWWSNFSTSWPNEYADWMEDIIAKEMPEFNYSAFDDWIENGDALNAPTCFVVIPKVHAMDLLVNGSLSKSSDSPSVASKASSRSTKSKRGKSHKRKIK